jgi:hypothetical protein
LLIYLFVGGHSIVPEPFGEKTSVFNEFPLLFFHRSVDYIFMNLFAGPLF